MFIKKNIYIYYGSTIILYSITVRYYHITTLYKTLISAGRGRGRGLVSVLLSSWKRSSFSIIHVQ